MALTFFWRCEGTTLDGTHDFTAGDNTATANNTPSISATAAKVGSNGILIDSSADGYRFAPTSIIARLVGTVAFWFQFPVTFAATGQVFFFARGNASVNDHISIGVGTGGDEVRLSISNASSGGAELETSGASLAAGSWYFVTASWDQPSNSRKIAVYDSSGTLLAQNEDTTTAYDAPAALDAGDGLRFGDASGWGATRNGWFDNTFVGSAYTDAATFLSNRDITSYTEYSTGGSATVTPAQAALTLNGRTPTTSFFQFVRIREVLVNGSGQAVGSATSIGLRVWYSSICAGAPDVSLNGMTTDADGSTSWSIPTGTLGYNDPIFFVAQNSLSYSHYTCGRLVPSYE
jgi:hypothetical protein